MKTRFIFAALIAAAMGSANASSMVGAYSFVNLGLGPLGGGSYAFDINNNGQVVGGGFDINNTYYHATLWSNGTTIDLGTLYGYDIAYGINNSGVAVGYAAPGGAGTATQYGNGGIVSLATYFAQANAINDAGDVVGVRSAVTATMWRDGGEISLGNGMANDVNDPKTIGNSSVVQAVGVLSADAGAQLWTVTTSLQGVTVNQAALPTFGSNANALAINDFGQIVGYARTNTGDHAVLWSGGEITDLGTLLSSNGAPLGTWSQATDINNNGLAVGSGGCAGLGGQCALLWMDGSAIDMNSLLDVNSTNEGWLLTRANAVNDAGQIVGEAFNTKTRKTSAFLLTPVPEPSSYLMLLAGLGVLAAFTRYRQVGNSSLFNKMT